MLIKTFSVIMDIVLIYQWFWSIFKPFADGPNCRQWRNLSIRFFLLDFLGSNFFPFHSTSHCVSVLRATVALKPSETLEEGTAVSGPTLQRVVSGSLPLHTSISQ